MIYTVTLNPSIDYIVHVDGLQLGELNRMRSDLKLPGGKGINVSRILSRLGVENTALGFLGGFTGNFLKETLAAEKITTDFIQVAGDTRINIKLKHGEETEINGQGPAIAPEEADELCRKLDSLAAGDVVVLSGSVPSSLGDRYYDRLIEACSRTGARFVLDTTGDAVLRGVSHRPLLIKPNHHELAEMFNVEINSIGQIIDYGKKLQEQGAEHVLVSMAGDGAVLITKEGVYRSNVPQGTVRNSVGAGDSMIAGFVGAWARGGDVMEAFATGVACGSATAFTDDLAEAELIHKLRKQVEIEIIQEGRAE